MKNVPLRCELVARKNRVVWRWTVAANWMLEDEMEIEKVESGRDFVVYLTASGQLLLCGETPRRVSFEKFQRRHGQRRSKAHAVGATLKRMSMRERELHSGHMCDAFCCPTEVSVPGKIQVTQVACGVTHCVALGAVNGGNHSLFSWGVGEYGQLGLGDCQFVTTMTPVEASNEFHQLLQRSDEIHPALLRCGPFSTYLFCRGSSVLWYWGLLPYAGCETQFMRQGVPVEFPLINVNTKLVDVAVGMEHVMLLSDEGCVFTWGYGSFGQLGLGPSVVSNVENQPAQVDFFRQGPSNFITKISCGWNHCAAISRSGDVYTWGSNSNGQCGTKSKFCDYFQPAIVMIPHPEGCRADSFHRPEEIRCRGNSSSLLIRCANANYPEIQQAYLWGVAAPGIGILLPSEVSSFQSRLLGCDLGLENSVWLLNSRNISSDQPAWIVNEVVADNESLQNIEKGFTCLKVDVGSRVCIQVQPINKRALAATPTFSNHDDTSTNGLFVLSMTQHDSASTGAVISSTSITQVAHGNGLLTVEVVVNAQAHGRLVCSLKSSIGEVFGNEFVIDVESDEGDAFMLDSTGTTHENQHSSIRVLGIHVEGTKAENEERIDTKWYKLLSKRIRVYVEDTVIVLVESTIPDTDLVVQVEYRDNIWQYGLTHLDVVGGNKSRRKTLSVMQLRFPSPGQYFVCTRPRVDEVERCTQLLAVSCCLPTQQRHEILVEKHEYVWSKYQFALANTPQSANFSSFLASVLQHPSLRDSIVCSPWISTYDEESCESSFDFDREHHARDVLLRHPEHPFILWDSYLIFPPIVSSSQHFTEHDKGTLSLNSILPEWATILSSKVALRIETWLEKPTAEQHRDTENPPVDFEEARITAATLGLSVQQIPFDFLGSVSHPHQSAVRSALLPLNPNIVNAYASIVSWRRLNGDLFYSLQVNELLVRRYGHESHEFPETAQNGRITQLRSQLSAFLWQKAEGKKIEELFVLFTSPSKSGLKVPSEYAGIRGVIHLRELIFHATALGFAEVVAVSKQEWFALFRGIQSQSPRNSTGVTFSTFRTFLIDPFHQFFWKQQAHQIREKTKSDRAMIIRILTDSFNVDEPTSGVHWNNHDHERSEKPFDDDTLIPWPDFIESVRRFHNALGLSLPSPSDCCRLLYRFDTYGVGRISVQNYQEALLNSLGEIDRATEKYDFTKASETKTPNMNKMLKVAIANGHRRPNIESFTSSNAVQKLFAARAKRSSKNHGNNSDAKLRASANTHLARIRNLPISHLIREGIYFRPPRGELYRREVEINSTQAQAMGAEDSF